MSAVSLMQVRYKEQDNTQSGEHVSLSSVSGTGRLSDEKCLQIKKDLETVVGQVFKKHGLNFSRQIFARENSREVSLVIRGSVIDANGLDALHRDLLDYCYELKFKASIMNASIISSGTEYQISGLDLSTSNRQFRLTSLSDGDVKFLPFDTVKAALPKYFF